MANVGPKLALGTAAFGLDYGITNTSGQTSLAEVQNILDLAHASGIDMLDTAAAYGNSEEVLGKTGVSRFNVVTKIGAVPEGEDIAGWINDQLQTSLARLGCERVYGLLLHAPDQLTSAQGKQIAQTLSALKNETRVQKIGISIYAPDILDQICDWFTPDLLQAPFNVFDQRLVRSGWSQRLRNAGCEIHLRSSFLQGLLLMHKDDIPAKFAPWAGAFDAWSTYCTENGVSQKAAALGFALSHGQADKIVIGVETATQLAELASNDLDDLPALPAEIAEGITEEMLIHPSNWGHL